MGLHPDPYNTSRRNMTFESQQLKFENDEMIPNNMYTHDIQQQYNMDPNFAAYQRAQEQMYSEYPPTQFYGKQPLPPQFPATTMSPSPVPQQYEYLAAGSPDLQVPTHFHSSLSSASGRSASSSTIGSPNSNHATLSATVPEWPMQGLGIQPGIAGDFGFDFLFGGASMEHDFQYAEMNKQMSSFVDPSILGSYGGGPLPSPLQQQDFQQTLYPAPSPAPSDMSSERSSKRIKSSSQSPFISQNATFAYPYAASGPVTQSPSPSSPDSSSTSKNVCPFTDCGKAFKDLKAHMLTHQLERPEKCPIATCDYHIKGFARKYDKNRHTLTHYKGTMVCGFCPGSGSAAEKSFNRADVFKRHLMSVHYVEQVPPNARRRPSGSSSSIPTVGGAALNSPGKCSTCSAMFKNAQDFYEHLDDCVLRLVQQEEPSEAVNKRRLAEVEGDEDVIETLRSNNLPTTTSTKTSFSDAEEDAEAESDTEFVPSKSAKKSAKKAAPATKTSRKKRKTYPTSWGCPPPQMKIKKRVLVVFDGKRRLWKDDMMMSSDYEVRCPVGGEDQRTGGQQWVTDLDVATMRRAEALHAATGEERGEWNEDGGELERLMK